MAEAMTTSTITTIPPISWRRRAMDHLMTGVAMLTVRLSSCHCSPSLRIWFIRALARSTFRF